MTYPAREVACGRKIQLCTLNMPNMEKTKLRNGNCSHFKTRMALLHPLYNSLWKGSPWSSDPEPLRQGSYSRSLPGKRSSARGVKHQGLHDLSVPSTCTKSSARLRVWLLLLEVSEAKGKVMAPVLWEKIWRKAGSAPSCHSFWWYRIKYLIKEPSEVSSAPPSRKLLPRRKFLQICLVTTHCYSSKTLLQAVSKKSIVQRLQCLARDNFSVSFRTKLTYYNLGISAFQHLPLYVYAR